MMRLLILLLLCFSFTCESMAQNTSWFYGDWRGETYFPNGPVTRRIIIQLHVTKVTGTQFAATLDNFYPNDTTVRLERELKGNITKKNLVIESNEQTYIRDPRTQSFWYDCTGCTTQSSFSINSDKVEIRIITAGCGDVCDGETIFSRDTSSLDSEQKIQLAKWFGLPDNKSLAKVPGKKGDTVIADIQKPVAALQKKDSIVIKAGIQKDTLISISKSAKKDSAVIKVSIEKDSLARVHKLEKKDTSHQAIITLKQDKKDSLVKQDILTKDTLPSALTTRATNLITTYQVTSPHITIQLYDNAEIDGDRVSVYHNGQLIVNHQTLTHKAITITINASKADSHHEFVMIADNLGLTPPNTALMRITAGDQKFELEVSSDFDSNAKIAIDYTGE